MSTAGEAASLFGASDPALDPFSTALGGDSPSDDTSQTANAVSDLFGSVSDEFPIDGAGSSSVAQPDAQQTWYDSAGQQTYGYDAPTTTGYTPAYQQTSYAPQNGTYEQYGQYGQYGQNNAYNPPAATSTSAYESAYGQQQTYAPQYATQTYAPYSQGSSSYPAASTVPKTPLAQNGTYSTSSYDPYKPTQTQSSYETAAYPATTSAPAPSSYDPYKPAHNAAPVSSQAYPYGTDSHTSAHSNSTVSVPPPPAPFASAPPAPSPDVSVAQYRPKTLDAYDPPIPPPKTKRVSIPPRQIYGTPPPATLSPPPRSTSTPQSLVPPPKGPRKTPDPHSLPNARRDSQSSVGYGQSYHTPSSTFSPPMVNGTGQRSNYGSYQPPPVSSPPSTYGAPAGVNGSYGPAAQTGGGYLAEGLPRVNDTYAPSQSAYAPGIPHQPDVPVYNGADHTYESHRPEHTSPQLGLEGGLDRVTSPSPIPEVTPEEEEGTPQPASYEPTVAPTTSSPPISADLPQDDEFAWNEEGVATHASPVLTSSSPSKSFSPPPRVSSAAPPPTSNQAPTSTYDPYAPPPHKPASNATSPPQSYQAPSTTYSSYAPPPRSNASDRAMSPSASSVRSIASGHKPGYEPSPRRDSVTTSPTLSRPMSSQSRRSTLSNSYDPPPPLPDLKRTASPAGSVRSFTSPKQGGYDPYAPVDKPAGTSTAHGRTTSNGSTYSTSSVADPYAPARHPVRASSEQAYGSFTLPASTYAPSAPPAAPTYDRTGAQVVTLAAPVHSTYAPSPSLLGTNDPLGRTAARVPVISFGFSGKVVTCFHGANMNTGFDVALSARQSTDIKIYSLNNIIPESVLDTSATAYPGPLYSDPGSPTASIVRTGAQALKAKKAKVVKYLEDRAEEMAAGLGYHRAGTVDRGRAEAKRILVLLLKVMVENDGRLSGSAQIDSAVRAALAPQDGASSVADASSSSSGMIPATSTEFLSSSYSLSSALPNTQDQTVSKIVVRSSHLDKIQDLLARGDRRGACHYAADEKLWPHALLIASSIDKECWKDVITEWIRAELVPEAAQAQGDLTNGREPLRVAYSLFGGNGAASIQELVHPKSLLQHSQSGLQIPQPQMNITPMTPNFGAVQSLNISQEVLATWAKTAAMILLNPFTPESSAALTALGDQLAAHQWIEAAHACYLLSPQTSPLGGMGSNPKMKLLGCSTASPIFYKDADPIIFSEIAEFAMSLATPAKGSEPFIGLPHLQPYRLIRATSLAELGHVDLASRYCDAITGCINRSAPYLNITFVEQLKDLSDRLTAAPHLDKSGSWIPGKMAKPSLDSIGNWLEGRFTKFIAGDGDSPRPEESKGLQQQQQQQPYSGPFANYSSISSATTSAYPSPHQSVTDLTDMPATGSAPPPFRAGSAMGNRPPSRSHGQINRASSAMDHVRPFQRTGSPIARVASANAAAFADAASYGQARTPYGNGYASAYGSDYLKPEGNSHGDVSSRTSSTSSSGWGASESDATTPTASSFTHMDGQTPSATSNSGFVSLMDDPMLSMTPTATKQQGSPLPRPSQHTFDDDDDDLGLGNSSVKKKPESTEDGDATQETQAKNVDETSKSAEPEKPESKQAASSGWLSRFWKRSDSTSPAPVKANLGEESAFYYDKELKRWVNKAAGVEAPKSAPPPPPPRAQTASPGRQLGALPPPPKSPLGPPPRPATAHPIDLSTEPPRRPPTRIRSNLVPDDALADLPSLPPSPLPLSGTPPPGNGPRRGTAGKRNVRSRYVDVFQQQEGGA